jgi:UDP-N-acetylglucosamine:LPS N-acetylglucosamine transferase
MRGAHHASTTGEVQGMQTIELVDFDAGGGRQAAVQALQAVMRAQQRPWRVRCVNLADLLDPQARWRGMSGLPPHALCNAHSPRRVTSGPGTGLKLVQGVIRASHTALVERLAAHWRRTAPDLVVSLIPNFSRALHDGLVQARPRAPLLTLMTDLADHPAGFWIEPDLPNQHIVCGSAHAAQQALDAGCPPARVHQVSGMVLRPEFHAPPDIDPPQERIRLGLDPQRPTAVVSFGGDGCMTMLDIARQLPDLQLLLLCGRDATLAQRLRALNPSAPQQVIDCSSDLRRLLALGDFFIGKPGAGCLSEAVQAGLPVITVRDAWTRPQDRYNTEWVRAQGIGLVGSSWRQMRPLVQQLLGSLPTHRAAVGRISNQAVFEVADLIAERLAPAPSGCAGPVWLPAPVAA